MTKSAIYSGIVGHRRLKPARHQLRYACYWLLIDLDELPSLSGKLKLFSHNRWNIFSLRNSDHGARTGDALRGYVERELAAAGLDVSRGPIRLLTMPRLFGYAFNPLSVFFCYNADGALKATLYEVRNTFGQRHSYLIPVAAASSGPIIQTCRKAFYVSPFMDMDLVYEFRLNPPGEAVSLVISARDAGGKVLDAWLTAARQPLTDGALIRLLFTRPLLTLKVIAAIHYEAFWLVLKGLRLRALPSPPSAPVTIVDPLSDSRGVP